MLFIIGAYSGAAFGGWSWASITTREQLFDALLHFFYGRPRLGRPISAGPQPFCHAVQLFHQCRPRIVRTRCALRLACVLQELKPFDDRLHVVSSASMLSGERRWKGRSSNSDFVS